MMQTSSFFRVFAGIHERITAETWSRLTDEEQQLNFDMNKLANRIRNTPDQMLSRIAQVENEIAQRTFDPQEQGRAFMKLAQCLVGFIINRADTDPAGARIALYGTTTGRKMLDCYGHERGYDGAFDAVTLAKELLPSNEDVLRVEKMLNLLDRKLRFRPADR